MIRYRCDGCGLDLAKDGSNHFIVKMEAYAAAGRLEFTQADLDRDHCDEMITLMADLEAGATGAMTGGGYPDGIRQIVDAYSSNHRENAFAAYER